MKSFRSRRLLLQASLIGATFALPGAPSAFGIIASSPSRKPVQTLFTTHAELLELGRSYLVQHPAESDSVVLSDLVSSAFSSGDLNRQFREEFAAGKTVLINGWLLSRKEARYYALCYLETQFRG